MPINRPKFWSGYIINPFLIEFWQGRDNRVHDRIVYKKLKNKKWKKYRLSPYKNIISRFNILYYKRD